MVLFLGTGEMIGRMLIMCSGFSIEKGKLPEDDIKNMYMKE